MSEIAKEPLLTYEDITKKAKQIGVKPEAVIQYLKELTQYLKQGIKEPNFRENMFYEETKDEVLDFLQEFSEELNKLEVENVVRKFLGEE